MKMFGKYAYDNTSTRNNNLPHASVVYTQWLQRISSQKKTLFPELVKKRTWVSTPLQEDTSVPNFPSAKRLKDNLTDLSMGKTEPSPAFSRLKYMENESRIYPLKTMATTISLLTKVTITSERHL